MEKKRVGSYVAVQRRKKKKRNPSFLKPSVFRLVLLQLNIVSNCQGNKYFDFARPTVVFPAA